MPSKIQSARKTLIMRTHWLQRALPRIDANANQRQIKVEVEEIDSIRLFHPFFHVVRCLCIPIPCPGVKPAASNRTMDRNVFSLKPASLRSRYSSILDARRKWQQNTRKRTEWWKRRKRDQTATWDKNTRACQSSLSIPCFQLRQLLQRAGGISWSWTPRYNNVMRNANLCEQFPVTPPNEPMKAEQIK